MRPWRPRSLTARILLAEGVGITVAALLLPLLLATVLGWTTRDFQHRVLLDQAQAVAQGLSPDGRGGWRVALPPPLRATYATNYDGRAYVVLDDVGRLRAASPYAGLMPWRAAPRRGQATVFDAAPFAGVSLPVPALRLWVVVTQDGGGRGVILDDIAQSFLPRYSALLLAVLLLLPVVNGLLIRRVVLSVRRVSAEATGIGPHNLHARLGASGLPTEMEPLVAATNALLDRLERSFGEQGQFVANVAHELRTPLAALRLRLGSVEDAGVRTALDRQVARLNHVISQLRDLGTLEHGAPDRASRFRLDQLAADLVGERAGEMAAANHPVGLEVRRPAEVAANRALVEMALTNLLDNTLRHTPAGTAVSVVVDGPVLVVEDDGPGLADSGTEHATRRFWRADHKRSDSAGLGLAIVRRIMEAHGGTLVVGNRQPRGAAVALRFPSEAGDDRSAIQPG